MSRHPLDTDDLVDDNEYYRRAHDQRMNPDAGLEPHMPDPDWGGVLVHPASKKMPVGDPTLWGNTVKTLIDDDPILGNTPRVIYSDQIVLAQAADSYSRSWSLTGTLSVPGVGWRFLTGANPSGPDLPTDGMNVFLQVIQGIGQINVENQINLACNGFASNVGLCWNQSSINGGPYVPTYSPTPIDANSYITVPFACVGALIGNTISVRAVYLRGGSVSGVVIKNAIMSCVITPYAPGHGI